jgi:protein-disulfide isomerase
MRRRTLNLAFAWLLAAPGLTAIGGRRGFAQDSFNLEAALGTRMIGDPDAKVTLVEYFSLTCPHCAGFHAGTYPKLKEKYIDTGKVKLEFRDFPLDQWALRAAALARCLPAKRYPAMISFLMEKQASWAHVGDPLSELLRNGELAGLDRDSAKTCMTNDKLLDGIIAIRLVGNQKYDIRTTPSFLLDGEKIDAYTFEEFDKLLANSAP